MGSSCPLLSSPTGNDPAFPKLALLARSHAGGLGASFGSAITESLLPEKAIRLSRNTVPPGSNCYRLRHGKGFLAWKPLNLQRTFFQSMMALLQNFLSANGHFDMIALTLQRTNFLRIRGCSFKKIFLSTFQRTENCRLLSMAGRFFSLRCPHCVGSENGKKGQSLRKNFFVLTVGAGCSSGNFQNLARR